MPNFFSISHLRTKKERTYRTLLGIAATFFWLFAGFAVLGVLISAALLKSVTVALPVIVYLAIFLLMTVFWNLVLMAHVRMNGIKVGPQQFPEIWEVLQTLSNQLGLPKTPDAFVIKAGGVFNAFATKLIHRQLIVIFSDLADALIEESSHAQLEAIIGHELGHHALGHTSLRKLFLLPGSLIPFLGLAYSRAQEYSADQVMKAVSTNQEACDRALIKLAAGKDFGKNANISAYLAQAKEEGGFFSSVSEILSTHPHLPNRILRIQGGEKK